MKNKHVSLALMSFCLGIALNVTAFSATALEGDSGLQVDDWGRVEFLIFEGHKSFTKEQIVAGLSKTFDFHLAARPSSRLTNYTHVLERLIQSGYQRAGFPDAIISVAPDQHPRQIKVRIAEGIRYLNGDVKLIGVPNLTNDTVRQAIIQVIGRDKDTDEKDGDDTDDKAAVWVRDTPVTFDDVAWQTLSNRVVEVLLGLGVQQLNVKVSIIPDPMRRRADLLVDFVEGHVPRTIEEIEVRGLQKNSRDQLLAYLSLQPGMNFQHQLLTDLTNRLWNTARFLKHEVTIEPLQKPECVRLVLNLVEFEKAPALDQELTPEQKALFNFGEWLERCKTLPDDFLIDAETDIQGFPVKLHAALSSSGIAVLCKHASSNQAPALVYAALVSTRYWGLFSSIRQQKLLCPPPTSLTSKNYFHLLPNDESEGDRFKFSFGYGFGNVISGIKNYDRLFRIDFKIAPVALLSLILDDFVCSIDHNLLTLRMHKSVSGAESEVRVKINATTGQPLEIVYSGRSQSNSAAINLRMESGSFERVVRQLASATEDYTNVFSNDKPISSTLGFIASDVFQTPLTSRLVQTNERQSSSANLVAWAKTLDFQGMFAPLDSLWPFISPLVSGSDEGKPFKIPQVSASKSLVDHINDAYKSGETDSKAGNSVFKDILKNANYYALNALRVSDVLWERQSWPSSAAHEVFYVLFGENVFDQDHLKFHPKFSEIQQLLDTKNIGPVGCLVGAKLFRIFSARQ